MSFTVHLEAFKARREVESQLQVHVSVGQQKRPQTDEALKGGLTRVGRHGHSSAAQVKVCEAAAQGYQRRKANVSRVCLLECETLEARHGLGAHRNHVIFNPGIE